jgi:aldehyde dehydrogenase (NAD+)
VTLLYVVSAIASGNCVVLKYSELAPNCSKCLVDLFNQYLDKDCFKVIEGGAKVSEELTKKKWDLIIFTGSSDKGKKVAATAGANLVPVILELGGKNPVVVDADADLNVAAKRIIHTRMLNWGATCVSPDYVIAHESVKSVLIQHMRVAILEFYTADPYKSEDRVHIVTQSEFGRLEEILSEDHGGRTVCGGRIDYSQRYISPTIIEDPSLDSKLMKDEIFGPIISVISFTNLDEALKLINSKAKPLAAY